MAEIAVRLHPLPQGTATAVGRSDDPAKLAAGAAACAREPLEADAFDVGWDAQGGAILVRLSGETASARVAKTLPLLADAGLVTSVEEDDDAIWARQREGQRSPDGVVVGVATGQASLRLVLEAARAAGATLVGRAALGLSWLRLDGMSDDAAVARVTELRERLAPASVDGHRRAGRRARGRRSLGAGRPGPPRAHAQREGPLRPDRRAARPGSSLEESE